MINCKKDRIYFIIHYQIKTDTSDLKYFEINTYQILKIEQTSGGGNTAGKIKV